MRTVDQHCSTQLRQCYVSGNGYIKHTDSFATALPKCVYYLQWSKTHWGASRSPHGIQAASFHRFRERKGNDEGLRSVYCCGYGTILGHRKYKVLEPPQVHHVHSHPNSFVIKLEQNRQSFVFIRLLIGYLPKL